MNTPRNPRWAETGIFETIQRFVDGATKDEVAAMKESFKRQANFMRRHGDEGRAAFWEALANAILHERERSTRPASSDPSMRRGD